jgi:uncharacterized protein YndB with AHSA1/START domain
MLTLQTRLHVDGLSGHDVFAFLVDCTDARYQRWWPGVHLRYHTLRRQPGLVGSLVFMDERIGRRRVRMQGVVVEAVPGTRLVWQLRPWSVPLPVWLALDLEDDPTGVTMTHTVRAGFSGAGARLDPLFRLYFTDRFAQDLDAHVREEFPRLRDTLPAKGALASASSVPAAPG